MNIWIGTGNKGKLSELKILLERDIPGVKVFSLQDLPIYSAPPENGETFLDNARIKAKSLKAMRPNDWVMADDSGLMVEALNNLPGVHSARYAGPKAQDRENTAKLLKMMQIRAVNNRNAKFVCTLMVLTPPTPTHPKGEEWVFNGEMKGSIGKNVVGTMGFGYDPVFIPEGQTQTMAELGHGFKNKHSHRALALMQFIEQFNKSEFSKI